MRRPAEDKARPIVNSGGCPTCGHVVEPPRSVPPQMNALRAAVESDPAVVKARQQEADALKEWEKRDQLWQEALAALATARIQRGETVFVEATGQPRPLTRRDRREEDRLLEKEQQTREEREAAGETLSAARMRHAEARTTARVAALDPVGASR